MTARLRAEGAPSIIVLVMSAVADPRPLELNPASVPGDINRGLRILRSRATAGALELVAEGLAGETYDLFVRSHRAVGSVPGVGAEVVDSGDTRLRVTFEGDRGYVRRKLSLPLN